MSIEKPQIPAIFTRILLFAIAFTAITSCDKNLGEQPDIVLVTLDTTRWDYLHSYGYGLANSPNLDKLAAQGSLFRNAITVAGTTFPAHASMLTGLYPRTHGARSNYYSLNDEARSVAEILAENGYQTGSFVSFKGMHNYGKLDRGFQTASDRNRSSKDKEAIRPGDETLKLTLDWLDTTTPESPMFLWMHLFEPHGPYDITPWFQQNNPDYDGRFKQGVSMLHIKNGRKIGFSDTDIDAMRQIYAGEINLADQYFGELINHLEALGRLDNTLMIIVSDHGQGMGENNQFGHGALLWESILRVPLIIVDFRTPTPAVVDQRVGVVDLSPTMLEAAGINIPANMAGRSLYPLDKPSNGEDRLYYAEVNLIENPNEKTQRWYDPNDLAVYMGEFKLQHRKGKDRLFSTATEENKLSKIPKKKAESLFYYLSDSVEAYLLNQGQTQAAELDSETLKELQGLGYTQ